MIDQFSPKDAQKYMEYISAHSSALAEMWRFTANIFYAIFGREAGLDSRQVKGLKMTVGDACAKPYLTFQAGISLSQEMIQQHLILEIMIARLASVFYSHLC